MLGVFTDARRIAHRGRVCTFDPLRWGLNVSVLAAVFNLNHPAHTVDWSFIHLSVSNVVVIGLMLVVFALAIVLPFPGAERRRRGSS
jgi:hypothetical protein